MEQITSGILLITNRKDSRTAIMACAVIVLIFLFAIHADEIQKTLTIESLLLVTLGSLLAGINFSLAYTHIRREGEYLLEKSPEESWKKIGRAFLGFGAVTGGIAAFSIVLSLLGFSTMLSSLSNEQREIGYIGLIILTMAMYTLAHRTSGRNVC